MSCSNKEETTELIKNLGIEASVYIYSHLPSVEKQ